MAGFVVPVNTDAQQLAKKVTMTVKVKRYNQWHWRMRITFWLLRLAQWVSWNPLEIVEVDEPELWLYYCPSCTRDIAGYKPEHSLKTFIRCSHCGYQFLTSIDGDEAFAVNPEWFGEDGGVGILCDHGCHYTKPYGFVPMADCPVHD